ncbi:hypothetical protein LSH36_448g01039 [Paralvinella palmiformis]|uniref:CATSPERG C-terminal domain-containing protein n=1 Tax=Paralvinella palmiformis TaxID=53620 RepID=A0AAD9JB57_9ANNE|nr:hypothetical protein LSH36_448g01039 [Paralvinella palmiformis]
MQLSDKLMSSNVSSCSCLRGEPFIIGTASLEDRLLILTQAGLYELYGDYRSGNNNSSIVRSNLPSVKCAREIVLSAQSGYSRKQQLLLIGSCKNRNSVLRANFTTYLGIPLNFTDLEDADGQGPCQTKPLNDAKTCRIVTCTLSAINRGLVLCLLATTLRYKFVMFTDAMIWICTSTIICRLVMATYQQHTNKSSDDIIHSSDGGSNFYLMPWNISGSIVLTAVSISGFILFITEHQEIWVTQLGCTEAERVYPSVAWKTVNSRRDALLPDGQLHIMSAFFDVYDDLQLLLFDNGTVQKYQVPLMEILRIMSVQGRRFGGNNTCTLSDVYLVIGSQMLYTRNKMYAFSPPSPRPGEYFHDTDSLLVYHVLIKSLERYESKFHAQLESVDGKSVDDYKNFIHKWRSTINTSLADVPMHLRNGLTHDLYVDLNHFDMGQYIIDVKIGCVPGQYIMLDWQEPKNKEKQDLPSFFFLYNFYPHFNIYDDVTGQFSRFEGNYTLKIIGGKYREQDDIQMFSEEEVVRYNKLGRANQHTVWYPTNVDQPLYDGWPVYTEQTNSIIHVDHNSYCDYTKTFLVHVHGLQINDVHMSTVIVGSCLGLFWIHILIYFCTKSSKLKEGFPTFDARLGRKPICRINASSKPDPDISIFVTTPPTYPSSRANTAGFSETPV